MANLTLRQLKQRVRSEWPLAWYNRERHTVEGYSEGLILGQGSVNARSIEKSAWADALASRMRRHSSTNISKGSK